MNAREAHQRGKEPVRGPPSTKNWERQAPYEFHECLTHADVTYIDSTGEIKQIVGILNHVKNCLTALMTWLPMILLHPHVVEIVLAQLSDGAR